MNSIPDSKEIRETQYNILYHSTNLESFMNFNKTSQIKNLLNNIYKGIGFVQCHFYSNVHCNLIFS